MALVWSVTAAVLVIVFFDWVPTPLNRNIVGARVSDRVVGTSIHTAAGALIVVAAALRWQWVVLGGAIWFTFVLTTAIVNWWLPWLTGWTAGELTDDTYLSTYARNTRILPALGRSPIVPDLQHTLVHLGLLAAALLSWTEFITT